MTNEWFNKGRLNEVLYAEHFLKQHPMRCVKGKLYTVDGAVSDEAALRQEIYYELKCCVTSDMSRNITKAVECIKLACYVQEPPLQTDRIHVANGTVYIDNGINGHSDITLRYDHDKEFCMSRLPVNYDPDSPKPKKWLAFLEELLHPEDIPTLQEYLGYCLIPTTKAQQMCMLIGRGGEGKSRVGLVMRAIFGEAMTYNSLQKVEENRFARADLEHKLLMVDDDMRLSH